MPIVWLASYPKSGNTWTRAFLTAYLGDEDQAVDINDLEGGPIASSRWFAAGPTGTRSPISQC